ncbi:hypothetical protein HO415_00220 [Streptococcus suis]|nr:hypothetical protein [Streptococcus suis]
MGNKNLWEFLRHIYEYVHKYLPIKQFYSAIFGYVLYLIREINKKKETSRTPTTISKYDNKSSSNISYKRRTTSDFGVHFEEIKISNLRNEKEAPKIIHELLSHSRGDLESLENNAQKEKTSPKHKEKPKQEIASRKRRKLKLPARKKQ